MSYHDAIDAKTKTYSRIASQKQALAALRSLSMTASTIVDFAGR